METILITVNLQGRINGCVKHTTKQEVRIDISKPEDKFPKFINKKILHTDRGDSICTKKLKIDESILKVDEVAFSAGKRGFQMIVKVQDILTYLNVETGDIIRK